jgi:hypothetical protein
VTFSSALSQLLRLFCSTPLIYLLLPLPLLPLPL